jgi:outer membrane lipoprotein-sorting protein
MAAMSSICLLALVVAALFAGPASAAFGVDDLMREIARRNDGRAAFVETRYLALLDKPVVATGELAYVAPDRLVKRTRTPKPELMVLEKDRLTIEREQKKFAVDLAQYPEARAFVDSIRSILAGDRQALEKSYLLHVSGSADSWELVLLPGDEKIANFVLRITVAGHRNQVRSVEYRQTDGDRSVMSIEPIETR